MMFGNDELGDEYNVTIKMEGDSTQTMVIKNLNGKHKVMRFKGDCLTSNCKMMMIHNPDGMPCLPPPPPPPSPGQFSKHKGMIDLNDPSIISYEKKVQKDGTEKITIIRKLE